MSEDPETTKTSVTSVNCPTCKIPVVWNELSTYRPFCSQRCQQIDFGEWASENFSIPGPSVVLDTESMGNDDDPIHH
jgi:endogenous inhibitor of DNA gyrase (YacG/DUF329 family)